MKPSIDRLDPAFGYVQGNVVWASNFANRAKSDLPAADFALVLSQIFNAYSERTSCELKEIPVVEPPSLEDYDQKGWIFVPKIQEKKQEILEIYDKAWSGGKTTDIAREHNISEAMVSQIKYGDRWNRITQHKK